MPSVGIVILLSIAAAVLCVKARAAGPAAVFAALSVVFVVSTPVGSGVPGAVARLFSVVDSATAPVLTHELPAEHEAGVRR
jgi:hypothetical protein